MNTTVLFLSDFWVAFSTINHWILWIFVFLLGFTVQKVKLGDYYSVLWHSQGTSGFSFLLLNCLSIGNVTYYFSYNEGDIVNFLSWSLSRIMGFMMANKINHGLSILEVDRLGFFSSIHILHSAMEEFLSMEIQMASVVRAAFYQFNLICKFWYTSCSPLGQDNLEYFIHGLVTFEHLAICAYGFGI